MTNSALGFSGAPRTPSPLAYPPPREGAGVTRRRVGRLEQSDAFESKETISIVT